MAKPGPPSSQLGTLAVRLRRELDHVDGLIDGFLTLAQAQRGEPADEGVLSLDSAASAAIDRRSAAIASLRLHVLHAGGPPAWVCGSQILLSRLVENLVDNAVRHNEPGGWVHVRASVEGATARLAVENGGAVFNPDEVASLGRPFQRLGTPRTGSEKGTGLGLSIVRSIAEARGGALHLWGRRDGGLGVIVDLPLFVGLTGRVGQTGQMGHMSQIASR